MSYENQPPDSAADEPVDDTIIIPSDPVTSNRSEGRDDSLARSDWSERRALLHVLQNITDGLIILNETWHLTFVNRAAEQLLGRARSELIGRNLWQLFPEADGRFHAELDRSLAANEPYHAEGFFSPLDKWLEVHCYPFNRRLAIHVRDIGPRIKAQRELHRREQEFETLVSRAPDIIARFDRQLRHIYVNRAVEVASGVPAESFIGKTNAEVGMPPQTVAIWDKHLRDVFESGHETSVEFEFQSPDGPRWFQARMVPEHGDDGSIQTVFSITRDITERQRSELEREELLTREHLARTMAEQAEERALRLQSVTAALSSAVTSSQVAAVIVNEGASALGAYAGSVSQLSDDGLTVEIVSAEGYSTKQLELVDQMPIDAGMPRSEAIRTGQPIWVESVDEMLQRFPAVRHNPGSISQDTRAYAILPLIVNDRVIGAFGLSFRGPKRFSGEDRSFMLTLAQQCAQALDRARLYEAERAARAAAEAAVIQREEFLSMAAHELKTPLTTVSGYLQLLSRYVNHPTLDRELIERSTANLREQSARLEALVTELLDVSRVRQGRLQLRLEEVDLSQVAVEVLDRFAEAPERTERHELILEAPEPVVGQWDESRLDQVLTNLVSNALKYSPEGGELRLTVRAIGDEAEFTVSDQGIGIPPAVLCRLFEPFVRAEQHERAVPGTGLGLYITRQIIEQHGGTIDVDSRLGHGSVFTVRLPRRPDGEPLTQA